MKLAEARRRDADAFLQALLQAGRGVASVHSVPAVISSAFATAVRLDLVQINPAAGGDLPCESTNKPQVREPD